jgi:hypothetical protein
MTQSLFFARWSRALLGLGLIHLLTACSDGGSAGAPIEAVEWVRISAADCESKGGQLVAVRNRDSSKALKVVLERWYMGVKTGDRGQHQLAPGAAATELGCSQVEGAEQRWELIDARYRSLNDYAVWRLAPAFRG